MDKKILKELATLESELMEFISIQSGISNSDRMRLEKTLQRVALARLKLTGVKLSRGGSKQHEGLAERIYEDVANIRKLSKDPNAVAQVLDLAGDIEKILLRCVATYVEPDEPWPRE
ncbi:MAG: hypothetical protein ACYS0C_07110 [Planctomycetota bacterium]|jgi:hypothetical protein